MSFVTGFNKTAKVIKMRATPKKHGGKNGRRSYDLEKVNDKWTCSCPDFMYRRAATGDHCKHIKAHLSGKKPWELEKVAAFGNTRKFLNKLKGLITGNETFYHNTSARNARRIAKEGFNPNAGGKGVFRSIGINGSHALNKLDGAKPKTYFSDNPDVASSFGKHPYLARNQRRAEAKQSFIDLLLSSLSASSGKQIKVEIPKTSLKRLGTKKNGGIITMSKPVPARFIKRIK